MSFNRKSQPTHAYLANHTVPDSLRHGISFYLDDKDTISLAHSGFNLHSALKKNKELDKRALMQLLQAMIDHDIPKVTRILQCKPELLLIEPAKLGINAIESKKTWQRFLTEKVFIMSQKLDRKLQRPPTMTKALLPHFNHIKQNEKKDITTEVVKQWILPVVPEDKEERKQWEEKQEVLDKALRKKYINDHFKNLIKTLADDYSIEVKWEMNNERKLFEAQILNESDTTKKALIAFRNMLLPDEPVAIDEYFDIAQFLIAACIAYDEHFSNQRHSEIHFRNWHQRDAYAVCVIGFIIPLLGGPEVGKKLCRGFYYDVNNLSPSQPNPNAEVLQLRDGRAFYRDSRISLFGPGFTFSCNFGDGLGGVCGGGMGVRSSMLLENYVKQTRLSLANLRDECTAVRSEFPQPSNHGA